MPTIIVDWSYLNQIVNASDPFVVALLLLKAGGWFPVLIIMVKALSWAWLDERTGAFVARQKKVFLAIDVPKNNEQLPKAVENIFAHIQGAYSSATSKEKWIDGKFGPVFSFEIVSIGGYIQFVIMTWEKYRDVIEALVYSQYPEAEITEIEDYTKFAPQKWPSKTHLLFGAEFVLKNSSYFPIKTYPEFEEKLAGEFKDPMASLMESLSKLLPEEQVWLQFIIQLEKQDWVKGADKVIKKLIGAKPPKAKEGFVDKLVEFPLTAMNIANDAIMGAVETKPKKEDKGARSEMLFLSPGEKTMVEAVERKVSKIGHKSKIRFIYITPWEHVRTSTVIAFVRGALQQFTIHGSNSFSFDSHTITRRDYGFQKNGIYHWLSLGFYKTVNERQRINFRGYKNRSIWTGGKFITLNTEELATLWHFPVMQVKAPLLKRTEAKRAEPPVGLPLEMRRPPTPEPTTGHGSTKEDAALDAAPDNLPFA